MKLQKIHGVTFYPSAVAGKDEATFLSEQAHLKEQDNGGLTDDQLKDAYSKLSSKGDQQAAADKLQATVAEQAGDQFKPTDEMTPSEKKSLDKASGRTKQD
jgi:hypothetical protein